MNIHIHHRTSYQYTDDVSLGTHRLMMRPRESQGIRLEECVIEISPEYRLRWIRDVYENNIAIVDFTETARELVIDCRFSVKICERNPFDFVLAPEATEYPFVYDHELLLEVEPLTRNIYVRDLDPLQDWLDHYLRPGKTAATLDLLQELNRGIYNTFKYRRREIRGVQSPAETLEAGSGSCRDFATLFIEACRLLGLAARFVSGYMSSPGMTGRMSMHGWTEVYLPGAGWVGFDPSWGILADSQYIPAAVARHSEHAPPISGTYFGTPRMFSKSDVDLFVTRPLEAAQEESDASKLQAAAAL